MASPYAERIATLHRELGIPEDYALSRSMRQVDEASELIVADRSPDHHELFLTPYAAAAWASLKAAAGADAIPLLAYSGFRSVDRQGRLIRGKREAGQTIADILRSMAAPGYSEHHSGRAIDVGAPDKPPLTEAFELTDQFRWLSDHAARFGFRMSYPKSNAHGIIYEPWHWCFEAGPLGVSV